MHGDEYVATTRPLFERHTNRVTLTGVDHPLTDILLKHFYDFIIFFTYDFSRDQYAYRTHYQRYRFGWRPEALTALRSGGETPK
jgi:hypothetical protein